MRKVLSLLMFLTLTFAASSQFIYNPAPMAQQMFQGVQFIYTPSANNSTVTNTPAQPAQTYTPAQPQNSTSTYNYESSKRDNLNRVAGETCQSCKGTGKCHACNGTKVAHSFGNSYQCNVCDANGNCPVCHGTGKTAWNR